MKKIVTIERIIIVVLLIITVFALIGKDKRDRRKDEQITQLQLEKQHLDSMLNERGQTILKQEVIVTESQDAIASLTDSIFALKRSEARKIRDIISYYKGITNTRIDSVEVPYVDEVERKRFSDSVEKMCKDVIKYMNDSTITVPISAVSTTPNYSVDFTATKVGININSISIPDTQYIRFVTLKGGLLKKNQDGKRKLFLKRSVRVDVLHTNPLVQVTGQNSVIFQPPNKPRLLEKAVLVGAGVFLGSKL